MVGANKDKISLLIKKTLKNLNEEYRSRNKPEIIGRKKEIKEVTNVLSRLMKNNAMLIGHPGVGKTAVVEGLVQQIEKKEVPDFFFDKNILQLDLVAFMAGTELQGEIEMRLKAIIDYVSDKKNNSILFIDEIHTITTKKDGRGDIANFLKPSLARGEFQCIGATTYEEYYVYVEKDSAFTRRFSNIFVQEPSLSETFEIINGIRPYLENFHKLRITNEALEASIDFSQRYLTDRYFPDKAIDLIDEACSKVKSEMWYEPEIIESLKKKIEELEIKKVFFFGEENLVIPISIENEERKKINLFNTTLEEEILEAREKLQALLEQDRKEKENINLINKLHEELAEAETKLKTFQQTQDYLSASQIKYEVISKILEEKIVLEDQIKKNTLRNYFVKRRQIAQTISRKYLVDVDQLLVEKQKRLLTFLPSLKEMIKGQDEAINLISDTVFRVWAEIQEPTKPLASFLFVGPTGVGKTEISKAIAKLLFGNEKGLWRFDMTEFSEPHSVSKFLGSPPGYIGSDQTSLFEVLKERISNVFLFDEIEKAHPEIINIFLQILDNGFIRLANKKEVNFRNSIIVFTSNLASDLFFEDRKKEDIKQDVEYRLKTFFRPEFLNRLSEVVVFNILNENAIEQIIAKELGLFFAFLEEKKKIKISYQKEIIKNIKKEAYSIEDGVRPIKKYIEKKISTLIAKNVIFGVIRAGGTYSLELEEKTNEMKIRTISLLNSEENIRKLS